MNWARVLVRMRFDNQYKGFIRIYKGYNQFSFFFDSTYL